MVQVVPEHELEGAIGLGVGDPTQCGPAKDGAAT
jgi:hypothetical protein